MASRKTAVWMLCLLMAAGMAMALSAGGQSKASINMDKSGAAIKGYDAVAYFTKGGPEKGKDEYSFNWEGAKWLFSSQQHKDLFTKNPEKYAPQYGGY